MTALSRFFLLFAPLTLASASFAQPAASSSKPQRGTYVETFEDGPGGWIANRYHPLTIFDGVAYLYGPWYLDSHHAPPGAGYLHMLMYLFTKAANHNAKVGGVNRFASANYSTDLRNAKVTVRLRGEIDLQGANMVMLVQAKTPKTTANFVLTGQPIPIQKDWTEHTIVLKPDPAQWTCLGGRESMKERYGCDDIETVLKDLNFDMMFVLFPLNVVPVKPVAEPHKLRAGQDYPDEPSYEVWQKYLPKGLIMVDSVRIQYPD